MYPERNEQNDVEMDGSAYVTIPLYALFRTLENMPYCPLSHNITEREKIYIFKIANLLELEWPKKLTWNAYLTLIGQAYKRIGEMAIYQEAGIDRFAMLYQEARKGA